MKTGLFFQEQKMSEKNSFSCCFAPSDHAEKDNTVPASPSQCGLHWSIFTNRPAYLKPSAAVISPGCAPKTKPDRLRDTLVQRTATKTHNSLSWRQRPGAWNVGSSCFLWSEAVLPNTGGTRLPKRRRSTAEACMRVCVRVFVYGEYYNLNPECKGTRATSTAIKVLQSLEEHFVTACTLVKPHQEMPEHKDPEITSLLFHFPPLIKKMRQSVKYTAV